LAGADVKIAPGETGARASTDLLGPALVSDISSYSKTSLPIGVEGAPMGYDLGSGLFEVRPGLKSGYALTVGSDYSVIAEGTVASEDGKPISLISGLAKEQSSEGAQKVAVFTNAEGRFVAEGLKPGRWSLEFLTTPPACFDLVIPEQAGGYYSAGQVTQRCHS